ncbi:MAG: hypothetical protein AAF491_11260 [Verrucomicrobiota bacterium]
MSDLLSVFDEISVSFENPALDAMGYNSVAGKLSCQKNELILQFKQKDRAFRKNPLFTVSFLYDEIELIEFHSRWFQPKRLVFQTSAAEKLKDFPGAGVGSVELFLERGSISQAKKIVGLVEFRKSEASLMRVESRLGESGDKV